MLFYPQLRSGALTCFPFQAARQHRTLLASEPSVRFRRPDTQFHYAVWNLTYREISSDEFAQLEELFRACEGRLRTFTFLDPTDNLLLSSQDLTSSAWTPGGNLSIVNSTEQAPGGGPVFEIGNTAQSDQSLTQTIGAPPHFRYCFSLWLRSPQSTSVTLFHRSTADSQQLTISPRPTWRRYWLSSSLPAITGVESSTFGIVCAAGAQVAVSSLQVEAQPNPSAYQPTTTATGIHAGARFDQDFIRSTNAGPDSVSTEIRVIAPLFP